MIERMPLPTSGHPHFIGCWTLSDKSICERIIALFESLPAQQRSGKVGDGEVDVAIKRSTDINITPGDLAADSHAPLHEYMDALLACYQDYLTEWPFLAGCMDRLHIGPFNIQRYNQGGHFSSVHSERTSLGHLHRVFAWMTYLNDVPDSGETEFVHYNLKVSPEIGKTLIWPAEWTHAHRGLPVTSGHKYIVTGWLHFPDD